MDAFHIKWTDQDDRGFVDVLDTQLFAENTEAKEIIHPILGPRNVFNAKCLIDISNDVALLTYDDDKYDRWWPGVTQIVFTDHTRRTIKAVLWADEGQHLFVDLNPEFKKMEGHEISDEVRRQIRLGRVASRPKQWLFSAGLRELYQGKCAITGSATPEALEAAHIRVGEHTDINDLSNGILLRSDLHALFDAGLFSLSEDGTRIEAMRVLVDDPSYAFLTNASVHRPSKDAPSSENIQHHRRRFAFD
jgi:hypothetical protein